MNCLYQDCFVNEKIIPYLSLLIKQLYFKMKKQLSFIFAFSIISLLIIGCSSEDNSEPLAGEQEVFTLDATGNVAEQTAVEAKKTISGKWNIGGSGSTSKKVPTLNNNKERSFFRPSKLKTNRALKGQNCSLNYIEFTDDLYAISIDTPSGSEAAFGQYTLVETNGTVSAVELYVTVLGNNHLIATLTNIVVSETANDLNATFDVVFNIPDDYEWACGSSLTGEYSAQKEEPLAGAEDASADSNFAKVVATWDITRVIDIEDGVRTDVTDDVNEVCRYDEYDYEEDCEQGSGQIIFSAYGTYLVVFYFQNGDIADWSEGNWNFTNSSQSEIRIYENYEDYPEDNWVNFISITTLNNTEFSGIITDPEDEGYSSEFTFTKSTN